jgi:hypothetical protein
MDTLTNVYDDMVKALRDNGYSRSTGANRWGMETWGRKGCPAIPVPAEPSATAAEKVCVQVVANVSALASARKPKRFRAKATAANKRASDEKRLCELEELIAGRNRELGGAAEFLTVSEQHRIVALIEKYAREQRELIQLMTSIPGQRADAGRPHARHRS